MATELRVRAAVALIQLQNEFTNTSSATVRQLIHEQAVLYSPFGQKDHTVDPNNIVSNQINMVFRDELITTLTDHAWSGMWQIIALSTALQMPIWSIYPNFNPRIRHLFHKLVLPLITIQTSMFILPVMWSGYRDASGFHANHFVPMFPEDILRPQRLETLSKTTTEYPLHVMNNIPMTEGNKSQCASTQNSFLQFTCSYKQHCATCQQRILTMKPKCIGANKYLCSFCYRYFSKGEDSPLDQKYMYPGQIPDVLSHMNSTELKLISQVHPYMNMVLLPSGGQHGLKGQSINIPVPIQTICSQLPRTEKTNPYIKIYSAKGNDYYETVNMSNVHDALHWLISHNELYKDYSSCFLNYANTTVFGDNGIEGHICTGSEFLQDTINSDVDIEDISMIPIDYQVNINNSDLYLHYKMPLVKGAPVNIFTSPHLEELAFPKLYPYGTHGLRYERPCQPSITQYFKCRLLNRDKRWSSNPQYLFWALHIYEQEKLQSAISVALRQKTKTNEQIRVEDVTNAASIEYKTDNYMFMKNIRGTAAYWKNELSILMTKIRTLGAPTFFLSLSANDMNWIDNIQFIDPTLSEEDIINLTFKEKSKLLSENAIASAVHFSNRWEAFLHHFLLQKPYPLGHVLDYFSRIEFQLRGSPHLHILLWIADAPNLEIDVDRMFLVPFIDRYISAQIPLETNSELRDLVKTLQIHSHTHTCQRNKKISCRFDFPMPESSETRLKVETDTGSKSRFYILKRTQNEIYVNPYNSDILKNWQANMDIQFVGSMYSVAKYVCAYICKNEPLEFRRKIAACMKQIPPGSSQRKIQSKIGNILLTHRTIGLQETAFRILGLQMVYNSRESVFVNVNVREKRFRILKRKKDLQQLSPGSTDIYAEGFVDYYLHRPEDEIFTSMCLAEFVTKYKLTTDPMPTGKKPALPRYVVMIGGTRKLIMQRSKSACLRCYIPDILKDEEGYYFSLLYLFLPFTNEDEIMKPYNSFQEAFRHKHHLLNQRLLQMTNLSKKFELAVNHLLSLDSQILEDLQCIITPSYQHTKDISTQEGISDKNNVFTFDVVGEKEDLGSNNASDYNVDMFKKLAQLTMTEDEYQQKKLMMSPSQQNVFEYVESQVSSNSSNMHLFITGGAGTGKSFLLRILKELLLRKNTNVFPNVLVAAPTGVAAYNINGHTLHTLLQLPTQDKSNAKYRPLSARSYKFLSETFKYVDFLIIDEISMVSYNTLEHVHLRLNEIKGHYLDSDIYFGNINIIAFGDLYQLPPVFGSAIFAETESNTSLHLWKDFFHMFELLENKRQAKDPEYAAILNRIRTGHHTAQDIDVLQSRIVSPTNNIKNFLHIFPSRNDRTIHNNNRIQKLGEIEQIYEIHAVHNVPDNLIPDDDQKCAGIPRHLMLCKDARVMLIRNIDTTEGLVNGAQGTVHSIEWDNNSEMPRCVNVSFDHSNVFPTISTSIKEPIGIKPITVTFLGNNHTYIARTQIPLVLSFTTTIHKVQGLTLENAVCDLGPSIFRGGMAYVALSRVSALSDLYLTKLCSPRIYPSKSVTEEMERLREFIN